MSQDQRGRADTQEGAGPHIVDAFLVSVVVEVTLVLRAAVSLQLSPEPVGRKVCRVLGDPSNLSSDPDPRGEER